MRNRSFKDRLKDREASNSTQTEAIERRSSPRKPIIASAQVVEVDSGARLRARSCDLVVQGCYIDTINPFPPGTLVRIRLEKGGATFDSRGKVVYRQVGLGMGIAFLDVTNENHLILEQWLSLSGTPEDPFEASVSSVKLGHPRHAPEKHADHNDQFVELIQMLNRKGVLTETDVVALMRQTFD